MQHRILIDSYNRPFGYEVLIQIDYFRFVLNIIKCHWLIDIFTYWLIDLLIISLKFARNFMWENIVFLFGQKCVIFDTLTTFRSVVFDV